jgi:hypothetical protein
VTFLGDSYSGALNWAVTIASNNIRTLSGKLANLTAINLVTGQTYSSCTGSFQVPTTQALAIGQQYYGRVFAINTVGYSLPQTAPSSQKPMVVPGAPTTVTLSVLSESELRVVFNPPRDDGGDTIFQYQIEYSINSAFSPESIVYVTYLSGGAPFQRTLSNLQQGVFYFVRVSACNSQGCGTTTDTVPPSLNPYQASAAPTNAQLVVTSDTMLTVGWQPPSDTGGDVITKYRVEWDTSSTFNSLSSAPQKGFVELDANSYNSYTFTYLTAGQRYYARVFAINGAGLGIPALTTPNYATPSLQLPGRPQTILAVTGSITGQIAISWQRPTIPWHNIPCAGLVTNPFTCPSAVGGGLPVTDGGSIISQYEISYNDLEDFSGRDVGSFTYSTSSATATSYAYTLSGLTAGRLYYLRVLARNAQGSGQYCRFEEPNCLIVLTPVSAYAAS